MLVSIEDEAREATLESQSKPVLASLWILKQVSNSGLCTQVSHADHADYYSTVVFLFPLISHQKRLLVKDTRGGLF